MLSYLQEYFFIKYNLQGLHALIVNAYSKLYGIKSSNLALYINIQTPMYPYASKFFFLLYFSYVYFHWKFILNPGGLG